VAAAAPFIAAPWRRVAATLIDLAILAVFAGFFLAIVGGLELTLEPLGILLFAYCAYEAGFLRSWGGETPGRRLLSIRVVRASADGDLSLLQLIGRPAVRPLLVLLMLLAPSFIALAVYSFSLLFSLPTGIDPNFALWTAAMPILLDLALVSYTPRGQSVADIVFGTIVVNSPPPQPHRAPAAPMYSPEDAEFGPRPRRGVPAQRKS
jgi:uncharacterized RDD family membrane protein YckC